MKGYIVSLSEANLLLQQQICSKDELLRRLSAQAAKLPTLEKIGLSSREIYLALLQREEELATTIGNGIIFPHARLPMLHGEPVVIIATLAGELHLKTPDDIPINIACMILIPDDNPMQGLKILSALTRNLKDQEFRAVLTNAKSFSDVLPMFGNLDVSRIESLMAADIALPPRCFATTDMPLKEATKLMVHFHTNAIPVLDNNRLAGQISSANLFKLGIPDFFTQMKSVGFIRYFDPFEKYFAIEANSLVRDVMSQDFIALPPDATLIEIVFAISVQHQDKVYIVNYNNELIGIIDQALLLERIINL